MDALRPFGLRVDSRVPAASRRLSPETRRRRRRLRARRVASALLYPLPFVLLIGAWVLAKSVLHVSDQTIVAPGDVLATAGDLLDEGALPVYVSESLKRLGLGAVLAVAIGVPLGLLLGANRYGAMTFGPFLRFFQAVSGIALLPLFLVWFGFTETTIQLVILYTALVPIIFMTMMGVRTIPPIYRDALRTLGGDRIRLIRDVYLPGALASIVVGVRLGIGYGWRALIAGEMLVGAGGLGFMIFDARRFHVLGQIVAGMIIIGILYVVIDRLILAPIEDATVRRWGVQRT
jgi:taurine transport system permease protein